MYSMKICNGVLVESPVPKVDIETNILTNETRAWLFVSRIDMYRNMRVASPGSYGPAETCYGI